MAYQANINSLYFFRLLQVPLFIRQGVWFRLVHFAARYYKLVYLSSSAWVFYPYLSS